MGNARMPLTFVILEDERPAITRGVRQAAVETALQRVVVCRQSRGGRDFRVLFKRREHGPSALLEEKETRDPACVTSNIADVRLLELLRQTIERFIGALFRWPRSSPLEEPHERATKSLVFPSRLLDVGVEPREKTREPGSSNRHSTSRRFYQRHHTY